MLINNTKTGWFRWAGILLSGFAPGILIGGFINHYWAPWISMPFAFVSIFFSFRALKLEIKNAE